MTRNQLIKELASRRGVSRAVATAIVRELLATIEAGLAEGKRVELRGFGTMRPRHYPAYEGRNPRTGERVDVAAKVLPAFRPGKALVEALNESEEES